MASWYPGRSPWHRQLLWSALAALVWSAPCGAGVGRAEAPDEAGILDSMGIKDPWRRLEETQVKDREAALTEALRLSGAESCNRLLALYQKEPRETGLRPALLRGLGSLGCRPFLPLLHQVARQSPEPDAARGAIAALGRLRDPRSLDLLEELAAAGVAPQSAVEAIWRYGRGALPSLMRLAASQGPAAPDAAAALARLGAREALPNLRAALASGALPPGAALPAIARLEGPKAVSTLLPWLSHPEESVRLTALEAISRSMTPRAVPPVLASLAEPALRQKAAQILADLGAPAPVSPLLSLLPRTPSSATDRVTDHGGDHTMSSARDRLTTTWVIRALGRTGGEASVEPLATLLGQGPPALRGEALDALQYTRSPRAAGILRRLARRMDPLAPRAILRLGSLLRGLGSAGPRRSPDLGREADRSIEELAAYTRGRSLPFRLAALRALGRIGDPRSLPTLLGALADPHDAIRRAAAAALGGIEEDRAVSRLITALGEDPCPLVRAEAAWALGHMGSHRVLGPLLLALEDPRFPVALNAATALGWLGLPSAGRDVAKTLEHPDARVRVNGILALERLGHDRARARLLRACRLDPHPEVRTAAARTLARVHGGGVRQDLRRLLDREDNDGVAEVLMGLVLDLKRDGGVRAAQKRPDSWIDLRLEDGAGRPLHWRALVVELSDGTFLGGATDADGSFAVERIPAGHVSAQVLSFSTPPSARPPRAPVNR